MRRTLALAVVLLAACQPESAAPSPSPSAVPIVFWEVDAPVIRGASAFGALAAERQAKRFVTIGGYELAAALPTAPSTLNAYIAGAYPDSDLQRARVFGEPGWDFVPYFSLLQYSGPDRPLGSPGSAASEADALARAVAVLRPRGLLPADTDSTRVKRQTRGWRVGFARRIDGRLAYTNKGLQVAVDANGQVTNILGRRRRLLELSAYPTRTAADAWVLAQAGRWLTFIVEDGAPQAGTIDRFVVRSVDIVYVEGEVLSARDIIRPYYVFRDANDQTIYVSAIANDGP